MIEAHKRARLQYTAEVKVRGRRREQVAARWRELVKVDGDEVLPLIGDVFDFAAVKRLIDADEEGRIAEDALDAALAAFDETVPRCAVFVPPHDDK